MAAGFAGVVEGAWEASSSWCMVVSSVFVDGPWASL